MDARKIVLRNQTEQIIFNSCCKDIILQVNLTPYKMGKSPKKKLDIPFSDWTKEKLGLAFGLNATYDDCAVLESWLNVNGYELSDFELKYLDFFREKAVDFIDNWNEYELRDNFIGAIVALGGFNDKKYWLKAFSNCEIKTVLKDIPLRRKAEIVVAIGDRDMFIPYFFLHEYKKEQGGSSDTRGQLLATMLAVQVKNKEQLHPLVKKIVASDVSNMPIYGCYVIGRYWHFATLIDKKYCFSHSFDATEKEDLKQIVKILKKQKDLIVRKLRVRE